MPRMGAVLILSAYLFLLGLAAAVKAHSGRYAGCSYNYATRAICQVFGPYRWQALRVAGCESGYSVHAHNGQYYGLFQMGSRERALFGGSSTNPYDQAVAAWRYFKYAHGWGPWSCRP